MSDLSSAPYLTSVLTIAGGISIFVVSQIVLKLVIEPIQQLKGAIGQTANTLLRHQAKITNAVDDEEVSAIIKSHAADLMSKTEIISGYGLARIIFGLPAKKDIRSAAHQLNLIGYSLLTAYTQHRNSYETPKGSFGLALNNAEALSKISKLLKVSTSYSE